jgi:hypothetical protein
VNDEVTLHERVNGGGNQPAVSTRVEARGADDADDLNDRHEPNLSASWKPSDWAGMSPIPAQGECSTDHGPISQPGAIRLPG